MVHVNGAITSTILKARFGDDVRKSSLHHNNDLTFIDLLLNVQRIFGLQGDQNLVLKYRDQDGDLVTLAGDSDLLFALNTVGAQLDITVLVDSRAFELVSDVQRQVEQIKTDVGKLLSTLSTLDNLASLGTKSSLSVAPTHENIVLQKSYEAPPSPVPSEKPELPATIDPSIQEQVDNFNHRPAHVEEEIPLEASYQPHQGFAPQPPQADSSDSSFSHPPIENFGAIPPPTATIPSFPTSNAAIPPVHHQEFAPPTQQQQFQAPPPPVSAPSHSSVSSTPIPQGPPSQGPPSVYGAPPTPQQFGAPPPPQGPPSEVGGYAPPPAAPGPQGFAPPPPQGFQPPPPQQQYQAPPPSGGLGGQPQGFQPPPPQQFGAPPTGGPGGPPPPQGFAPPPQQQGFAPPPQQPGFAPPPPSSGAPGNFAPPQSGAPGGFAPPPQGFAPPPGAPAAYGPPQGFGGPGAPPAGPPTFGPPPTGFPPGGPQAGGNPFARGPASGYRQSPYHQ